MRARTPAQPKGSQRGAGVRRRRPRRRGWRVHPAVAVVAVLTAVFALAVILTRRDGSSSSSAEVRAVSVTGDRLPPFTGQGGDPAVGRRLPRISGQTLAGAPAAIEPAGRPMVVILLAHWCPHCQNEVRNLGPWLRSNGLPPDVDLVSISTAVDPGRGNYPPSEWLKDQRWPVPVMADDADRSAATAVGLNSFPFFVFVAGDGTVRSRAAGALGVAQFQAALDRLRRPAE